MTNEEIIENYRKRKILRWLMIIFALLTIIFSVLSLTINLGIGYALVTAFITYILKRLRTKEINKKNNDKIKKKH